MLQRQAFQEVVFLALTNKARFAPGTRAESPAAVACWSDQAWPCLCDWNGDGVQDLLIGGGYGWPRIVLNTGSNTQPVWSEPKHIYGAPIRLLRDELLQGRHWHNMGYPYPVFIDWDGDGLPDLLGCVEWSVYPFYAHAALEMAEHPRYTIDSVRTG